MVDDDAPRARPAYGPDRTGRASNRGGANPPQTPRGKTAGSAARGKPPRVAGASGGAAAGRSSAPGRPAGSSAAPRTARPAQDRGRPFSEPGRSSSGSAGSRRDEGRPPAREGGRPAARDEGRPPARDAGRGQGRGSAPARSSGPVGGAPRAGSAPAPGRDRTGRPERSPDRPGQGRRPDAEQSRPQRGWEIRDAATKRASRGAWSAEKPERAQRPERTERTERPERTGRPERADRPSGPRAGSDAARPATGSSARPRTGAGPQRPGSDRPDGSRAERTPPRSGEARPTQDRPRTTGAGERADRGARPGRPRADDARRGSRPAAGVSSSRRAELEARPFDPRREARRQLLRVTVPDDVDPRDLDPEVRQDLRSLAKDTADLAAKHLIMTGRLLDEDPAAALAHARAAGALAGRIGSVREAVGIAAYTAQEWAEALSELRTARRITGRADHLAVLADCERALGRPERALAVLDDPDVPRLEQAARVELVIVVAGARRDLQQPDAAVLLLQGPARATTARRPWATRLWYAYADALLVAGREDEAREWFAKAAEQDGQGETDAMDRLLELDGVVLEDLQAGEDDAAEPEDVVEVDLQALLSSPVDVRPDVAVPLADGEVDDEVDDDADPDGEVDAGTDPQAGAEAARPTGTEPPARPSVLFSHDEPAPTGSPGAGAAPAVPFTPAPDGETADPDRD